MRDVTKQWIEELAYSIKYLFDNEPWRSYKSITSEIQDYYDCTINDFKKAYKIAEKWDRYGIS